MFLSEWRKFPSEPCLEGIETWWQFASRCCWNRARPWRSSKLVSFLVGLRNYQHPCTALIRLPEIALSVFVHNFSLPLFTPIFVYRGADKSLARTGRIQARKHVREERDFNNMETRAAIKFFPPARQGAEGNSRHSERNISLFPSWSG